MNLYELSEEYVEAFNTLTSMDELDGQTIDDTLEGLVGDLHYKMLNVAKYQQSLVAEAVAIKDAVSNMQARQKTLNNKADSMKRYLSEMMQKTGELKVSDQYVALSFRKSESILIEDDKKIDIDFMTVKTTRTVNKVEIKRALKSGKEVAGAALLVKQNLQIK